VTQPSPRACSGAAPQAAAELDEPGEEVPLEAGGLDVVDELLSAFLVSPLDFVSDEASDVDSLFVGLFEVEL
jgi:hypothetical protein